MTASTLKRPPSDALDAPTVPAVGEKKPRLVMKFGGTSVADLDRIRRAAEKVAREAAAGYDVAVVVSAMAGETNRLVDFVRGIGALYDAREYDAVVASGEQVTAGLMALTLQELGVPARSWLGWQIAVRTTAAHGAARIEAIDVGPLEEKFDEGLHAVIAGFQGVSPERRISTLGRGGSDTSAVAMAAALGAERCDIYTDVDGVYTTDPRIEPSATRIPSIAYEEMLELASLGAKVLQTRSVELGMRHNVPIRVLSSFGENVGGDGVGTLVTGEDAALASDDGDAGLRAAGQDTEKKVESKVVSGVAFSREETKITVQKVADRPGIAAAIFTPLADAGINVDMIVQNVSDDGQTDMTFTVPLADHERARQAIEAAAREIGFQSVTSDTTVAKVSIVGIGMRSHTGVAHRMFKVLSAVGVNIQVITTSEIKISVLIDRRFLELAVRELHSAFDLDKGGDGLVSVEGRPTTP